MSPALPTLLCLAADWAAREPEWDLAPNPQRGFHSPGRGLTLNQQRHPHLGQLPKNTLCTMGRACQGLLDLVLSSSGLNTANILNPSWSKVHSLGFIIKQ